MADADKKHAFMSIQLKGNDDDTILNNFKTSNPTSSSTASTSNSPACTRWPPSSPGPSATDQQRAEVAASRWWRCCCSSCSAAWSPPACPAIIGGLTIGGALGILRLIAEFGPVHFFAQPVVTMIGLGIASTTACSS
jgi:RND superfamily putative drug exporter